MFVGLLVASMLPIPHGKFIRIDVLLYCIREVHHLSVVLVSLDPLDFEFPVEFVSEFFDG